MSGIIQRYAEDPTGINPDNLVSGEEHFLSDRPIRIVVPKYGMFYTESLRIYDGATMQPLLKGRDFKIPVISQEASLRFAKEIGDAILIENRDVSDRVILTYQVLGGSFQNNIENIILMYEAWLNDQRGVDWTTGVFGKPMDYPPSIHNHPLSELFGFESFNFMLERVVQAILMGNTAAFEELMRSIDEREVTEANIDAMEMVSRPVSLRRLVYAMDKLNFNTILLTPDSYDIRRTKDLTVSVRVTNMPNDEELFWSVEHGTTEVNDFTLSSGNVTLKNGMATFKVRGKPSVVGVEHRYFRILIRKNGPMGHIMSRSYPIQLRGRRVIKGSPMLKAMSHLYLLNPRSIITPANHYLSHTYQSLVLS